MQGELEAAVERLTQAHRRVVGAGRTDRGVHAVGQVAAVRLPARWTPQAFRKAMNAVLPGDVWVESTRRVPLAFHPVRHAVARTYEYRLGLEEESASPFHRPYCWAMDRRVSEAALHALSQQIVGEHSFRAFAKSGQPQRGDRCEVTEAGWWPWEGLGLRFTITANRFLHHMVRYLVGTMVEAAGGRRPMEDIPSMLAPEGRVPQTSPPAPPEGLFLRRVEYPPTVLDLQEARETDAPEVAPPRGPES